MKIRKNRQGLRICSKGKCGTILTGSDITMGYCTKCLNEGYRPRKEKFPDPVLESDAFDALCARLGKG